MWDTRGVTSAGGRGQPAPASKSTQARSLAAATTVLLQSIIALAVLVASAPGVSAYAAHAPIRIDGDGAFTAANGVTRGAGTVTDPYVIEGWDINASMAYGIDVRNADASFIIRGNRIHSGGGAFVGVWLTHVGNGSVEDNAVMNNEFGIFAEVSPNIAIMGNNLSDNRDAIYLGGSDDSALAANRISSSARYGIQIVDSDNATIIANTLSNDANGIVISESTNVTLRGNSLTSEGVYIDDWSSPGSVRYFDTHTISQDNLVNGKPLYYHKDCTGLSVDSIPIGELIVANCTGVRISNLDITDTDLGIEMAYVTDATVSASHLAGNDGGIWIESSSDVFLSNNNATQNGHGFWLRNLIGVTLLANNLSQNARGMRLDDSENAALLANRVVSNRQTGMNLGGGLENLRMVGNVVQDNEIGVYVDGWSANLSLTANDVSGNRVGGLNFGSTANVTVTGNRVASNGNFGIIVGYGADTVITDNTVANNGDGIYLYGAPPMGPTGVLVHHNRMMDNRVQGFDDQGPENAWDDGYPSGGNWWSDYGGVDECSGPNQDVCPDADGIGDTPYILDADSRDRYPLMGPPLPRNVPPVAVLSVHPEIVAPGDPARVAADGSFDPDGTITAYNFTFGDGTWTGDVSTPSVTHVWPTSGTYVLGVVVTDDRGATSRASARASVVGNLPPHAVAGVSPGPEGDLGTTFTFDGTASWDAEGPIAAYRWEFGDGTDATGSTTTHRYAERGSFTVTLTTSDLEGLTDTVAVGIQILNRAPIANAGPDTTAREGTAIVLDGTGSSDPDGDGLTYTWSQIDGPSIALTGPDTAVPTLTPTQAGVYKFELTVEDGFGGSARDTVTIFVEAQGSAGEPVAIPVLAWSAVILVVVLALLVFAFWWRRRREDET